LTPGSIQFSPYDEHKEERPFEWISLFSGYLRLGNWTQLHMPECVLRQYGYAQFILRHPYVVRDEDPTTDEMDRQWLHLHRGDNAGWARSPLPKSAGSAH